MSDAPVNDERHSQLSAMFDNELPPAECELLARRVSRDDGLQRQWASYALIGAALRGEPVRARSLAGVVRDGRGQVAERVSTALRANDGLGNVGQHGAARVAHPLSRAWLRPVAGAGIAAGVAALSIFWLRAQTSVEIAANIAPRGATTIVLPGSAPAAVGVAGAAQTFAAAANMPRSNEPVSYTVPAVRAGGVTIASAQLANYVVAHSEFSGPLARRNLLSALVASDALLLAPQPEPDASTGKPANTIPNKVPNAR